MFVLSELCDNLFEILVSFAESTKRKAAVWPLQIMLLMLSPVSTAGQWSKTESTLSHMKLRGGGGREGGREGVDLSLVYWLRPNKKSELSFKIINFVLFYFRTR